MIEERSIQELKDRLNIVDVIGASVKLKKKGADYVGLCPFHGEKTPSFHVHPGKSIYKCFGCGKSGDSIEFVREHEGIGYADAIIKLAKDFNVELEYQSKREYVKPEERLQKVSDKMLKYFEGRKISNNTLLRFGITESKEWMPQDEAEVPVICFNYYRAEQLVNIKFRSAKKGFKMIKDAELILYNLDSIKESKIAYIVEGEFDALSLYEAGIYEVVSVPNGASVTKGGKLSDLSYLDNCIDYLKDKETIILVTDMDTPGKALREELARRLGFERCRYVNFPSGIKDANEMLVKHGTESLKECCQEWIDIPIEGIVTGFDIADEVMGFYLNGYPNGFYVPIPGFRQQIEWQLMLGQLTGVTGVPSSGKSEFFDWIMVKMSQEHGWKWGVISPENQPESLHATKLLQKLFGKSFDHRADPNNRMTKEQVAFGMRFIHEHFYFVKFTEESRSIIAVLDKFSELILTKGINGFMIDPWNKFELPSSMSETMSINSALSKVSMFCKVKNVHGIIIVHPTKMPKKQGSSNTYEVPTAYNMSGSANFYNQLDNSCAVHRDRDAGLVEFYLQKIRFDWLGREGFVTYKYNTLTRQYELPGGLDLIHPDEIDTSFDFTF